MIIVKFKYKLADDTIDKSEIINYKVDVIR